MTSSKAKGDPLDSWKPHPQDSPGNRNAYQQSQHNKFPNEHPMLHRKKWSPPPSKTLSYTGGMVLSQCTSKLYRGTSKNTTVKI